jgi:hypothetical protein
MIYKNVHVQIAELPLSNNNSLAHSNKNDNCETMKSVTKLLWYKQTDLLEMVFTIYFIILYIYNIRSLTCDP